MYTYASSAGGGIGCETNHSLGHISNYYRFSTTGALEVDVLGDDVDEADAEVAPQPAGPSNKVRDALPWPLHDIATVEEKCRTVPVVPLVL